MRKNGFTIVELLIVIVVIGILAAIVIVAYNGVQAKSLNSARLDEVKKWQSLIQSYVVTNGKYPNVTAGTYCLGTGFPDVDSDGVGDCWDLDTSGSKRSELAALNDAFKTAGTLPNSTRVPIKGDTKKRMGPVYDSSGGTYSIRYWITGSTCPIGSDGGWNDTVSKQCQVILPSSL